MTAVFPKSFETMNKLLCDLEAVTSFSVFPDGPLTRRVADEEICVNRLYQD